MRILTTALVLVCLVTTSAQAGLQNTLQNRLVGFRSSPLLPFLPPILEGALFIDPIESTRGEGVFRGRPDFEYDPTTGSLTVFAPPMLGPADEFGVRLQYSPQSINVFGRNFFSDSVSIPQVTKYRRNTPEIGRLGYPLLPFGEEVPSLNEETPSYVIDENSDSFNLSISPESIRVNVGFFGSGQGLTGAEIGFSSLLMPGLNAEVFEAEESTILPNLIFPYLPHVEETLPDVYFVVGYAADDFRVLSSRFPFRYSLLAIPQAGLFQDSESTIPEPSTIVLACCIAFASLFLRRA